MTTHSNPSDRPGSTVSDAMPNTARSLPIALLRARERLIGRFRGLLSEAGVTEAQWRVLRVLSEIGPTDASEVAREACLLMPSLTRILQALEGRGLSVREAHPRDGRKVLISVSAEGAALLNMHAAENAAIFNEIESQFGGAKLELLLDLLNELAEVAGSR